VISIFNGTRRGLDDSPDGIAQEIYIQVKVRFRTVLHQFKGSKLSIFMAVSLHANQWGIAFPSYDTLEEETGLERSTISLAVRGLQDTIIDERRVMLVWRERDAAGQFIGNNFYLIFPSKQEIDLETKGTLCLVSLAALWGVPVESIAAHDITANLSRTPKGVNELSKVGKTQLRESPTMGNRSKSKTNTKKKQNKVEQAPLLDLLPLTEETEPVKANEYKLLYGRIAELCGLDTKTLNPRQRGDIGKIVNKLLLDPGRYSIESLKGFDNWYWDEWHRANKVYPTLHNITDKLAQYTKELEAGLEEEEEEGGTFRFLNI
jgi:hypothetical protein